MMEILGICWKFVCDASTILWGLVESASMFVWDLLVILHVNHPRLEGLLIGITLAWLLARRDRHPLLRAASSPLNLIIGILDLAWDHVAEFFRDVWTTIKGWYYRAKNWIQSKWADWVWTPVMGSLRWLKSKLSRKEEKKEEG